jgi:hypothetical protein
VPSNVRSELLSDWGEPAQVVSLDRGFSPGCLAIVGVPDRRCFVKISGILPNERTPNLHRREVEVLRSLGSVEVAPALIGSVDLPDWAGLATSYVPAVELLTDQWLSAALRLSADIAKTKPSGLLKPLATSLPTEFLWGGFQRLAQVGAPGWSSWSEQHFTKLMAREEHFFDLLDGNAVLHGDLRADNVLVIDSGGAVAVDWPSAGIGNPLFDQVMLVTSWMLEIGHEDRAAFDALDAERADLVVCLIGILGHYAWAGSLVDPPGIPGVRAYQRAMRDLVERLLIHLID